MATFAKPENALKRAEELMNVGQKAAALQSLHDLITSKRYRTWQKPLERIMLKYVELCVDMRKGRFAKDGLIQYRIACQQVNVQSLEEVVKYFLKLATEKAEQAQAQVEAAAAEAALGEVADLEAEKSPEDLMLGFVSGEKGKERTDSELVTPWFKFLWEAYRTVLDVLRNNCKMEALYAVSDRVRERGEGKERREGQGAHGQRARHALVQVPLGGVVRVGEWGGWRRERGESADLEAEKSPEDLMLGFVSGEKGKERTDSELVTPWFKFLWF
ncbi:unnamed protein product [Closterium sp. NIES-65]|nr:unnamed protein product [Closterium sp. NIES-65]